MTQYNTTLSERTQFPRSPCSHVMTKGSLPLPKRMNFRKSSKRPLTPPPLIFGKSYCGFFIRLYSLKNHTCGIFLKSPGYESIKNNDPCCQIQCLNFKFWAGVVLRIWLKQGKEKRLLARILKFLEKARKRLSRQNSTKKCINVRGKSPLCENREHC